MIDLKQMGEMMSRVQGLQQKMKEDLAKMAIRGSSGGGKVKVVINGMKEVTNLEIDPSTVADPEILTSLILAALNQAYSEADKSLKNPLSGVLGGFDLSQFGNMFPS